MTIDPQAEAIKRLVQQAKVGSQRAQLVPSLASDPESPSVGYMWIRSDETPKKAYLQVDASTAILVAGGSSSGGGSGEDIQDRSIAAIKLMLNTITSNELAVGAVGPNELASGSVTGSKLAAAVTGNTNMSLTAPAGNSPVLNLNTSSTHQSDILRARFDGNTRFRVDPTHVSIGDDLPASAFSVQTSSSDVALRIRGAGGMILAENSVGTQLFSVDSSGNMIIAGSIATRAGNSETGGALNIKGTLTVSDQVNLQANMQVNGDSAMLGALQVNGRITTISEPYFPGNYSAKLGEAVHLRTLDNSPNRMLIEGIGSLGVAEIQLGTGGPVLRGSSTQTDRMFISGQRIVTSAAAGILGNQIATDTITGGVGSGLGNIAAETITGYNIKDASITSSELSPGAVVAEAIAQGAVGSVALGDGSVIDRVVASMGVGKLISGTLNADNIFMGPSGRIYLGPTNTSQITGQRIQIDAAGVVAYNSFNNPLAEFKPGMFALRTGVDGARLSISASTGLELFGASGARTGYLSPLGQFQLDSQIDGARMSLNSQEGVQFYAGATRNLAYNPGFIGGSNAELAVAGEAYDDQLHVFAGEWAVRFRATNPNIAAPSYVDVPFQNTIGTGQSVTKTRVNACTNPGLAANLAGYGGSALTSQPVSRVAVLGFIRSFAAQVQATALGAANITGPMTSVSAGQQWAVSCSARTSGSMNVTASIAWYDVNNALISSSSTVFAMRANVVQQIGQVGVAPSGATQMQINVVANLDNTQTLQIGDTLYERASGIDAFFDGDTAGYRWDGSVGASTSSLIPVPVLDSANNVVSIFVWSDVSAWVQIEGRDSTAGVGRGTSSVTRVLSRQWSRVQVLCNGRMDKVRLHYPSEDAARQTRITRTPLWWSALQVEADKAVATPFCSGNEPGCRWEAVAAKSASIRDRDTVVTSISPTLGTTASGAIVGGSLSASSFFAGRIFASEMSGGKIFGNLISGNQIHGDQILANTLHGDSIIANTIQGNRIVANAIATVHLQADSVDAVNLKSNAVTARTLEARLALLSTILVGDETTWHLELSSENDTPIVYGNNDEVGFALTRDEITNKSNVYINGRMEFGEGSRIDSDTLDLQEIPATGFMTPKARQSRAWIQSAQSTSISPRWTSPTMKNNMALITVWQVSSNGVPNCSTPSGSTLIHSMTNGNTRLSVWLVDGMTASRTTETITSSIATSWGILLTEFSGTLTPGSLDVANRNSGSTGTTFPTGSITPTQADTLQVAYFATTSQHVNKDNFGSATNGFTKQTASGSADGFGISMYTRRASTASAASTTGRVNGGNTRWSAQIISFKLQPASAVPTPPPTDRTVRFYTRRVASVAAPHVIQADGYTYPIARGPYCKVRLNTNYSHTANTDIYAQSAWVVSNDAYGMVAISSSSGVFSSITIPITGLYEMEMKTIFQGSTNTADYIAHFITHNDRVPSASQFRQTSRFIPATNEGTTILGQRKNRLAAGAVLYWGTYSSVNASVIGNPSGFGNSPTEITITYLGPGV